jgi:dihydropteroate synthase
MHLRCAEHHLNLSTPIVMGVVNVTPDSFSDGGQFHSVEAAVAQALRLAEEGAAILDIGGESTRPNAAAVSEQEELRRVVPVIEQLVGKVTVPISVDTSKPAVMRAALAAGAGMINDVRALQDPAALEVVAASNCAVCVMHMQGLPATMQQAPRYADVVAEVAEFLRQQLQRCVAAGIEAQRIVLDPGFGFGKTLAHNLALLRQLPQLAQLGRPLLVGLSRKSMLQQLLGRGVDQRLAGSLALAMQAVQSGARIIRAHDVAATVDVIKIVQAVRTESIDGEA